MRAFGWNPIPVTSKSALSVVGTINDPTLVKTVPVASLLGIMEEDTAIVSVRGSVFTLSIWSVTTIVSVRARGLMSRSVTATVSESCFVTDLMIVSDVVTESRGVITF